MIPKHAFTLFFIFALSFSTVALAKAINRDQTISLPQSDQVFAKLDSGKARMMSYNVVFPLVSKSKTAAETQPTVVSGEKTSDDDSVEGENLKNDQGDDLGGIDDDGNVDIEMVTTSSGQKLKCRIPQLVKDENEQELEKEKVHQLATDIAKVNNIGKSLIADAPKACYYIIEGWWTYEFCPGQHVIQKHVPKGKNEQLIQYSLGEYRDDSLHEYTNAVDENWVYRQKYVGGTVCDLTGKPRITYVNFICKRDEHSGVAVSAGMKKEATLVTISESRICVYELNFRSEEICNHPLNSRKFTQFNSDIVCTTVDNKPFQGLLHTGYRPIMYW